MRQWYTEKGVNRIKFSLHSKRSKIWMHLINMLISVKKQTMEYKYKNKNELHHSDHACNLLHEDKIWNKWNILKPLYPDTSIDWRHYTLACIIMGNRVLWPDYKLRSHLHTPIWGFSSLDRSLWWNQWCKHDWVEGMLPWLDSSKQCFHSHFQDSQT